ncbi:MAG: hypothetical protein Q4B03_01385 [Lachnospiraceae bacterium]|nr:hypothetical protein [Lachnospiraceae bacterium]
MFYEACQAKLQEKLLIEICPECGEEIEMAATDPFGVCEECGMEIRNEAMDCIFWCENAVNCVGEEVLEKAREEGDFLEVPEEMLHSGW